MKNIKCIYFCDNNASEYFVSNWNNHTRTRATCNQCKERTKFITSIIYKQITKAEYDLIQLLKL